MTRRAAGPAPEAAGAVLAQGYEVVEHLARGRALDVYDVWSEERDCRCVAKVVRPDRAAEAGPRRRLLREGRMLMAIAHPHVVRAYDLVTRPRPVLVLEALLGGSLQDAMTTATRRTPLPTVVQLGLHLCSAMHYVHARGLLHTDLKPANVMADRGFAKVIDFSLARAPGRAVRGRGTRGWMAPEQARGGRISAATDVWGVGAVLWAAAVGAPPFPSSDGSERYPQLVRRADRIQAHRRLPRSHAALGDVVTACLEPEARLRPPLGDVTDALDTMLDD